MLGYTPPPREAHPALRPLQRTVRILLECFLVSTIKIQTSEVLSYVYLSGAALTDTMAGSLYTENSMNPIYILCRLGL